MWCPDCGSQTPAGVTSCPTCGLALRSRWATELERANAIIHQARARAAEATALEAQWMGHREALRAQAARPGLASVPGIVPAAQAEPLGQAPREAQASPEVQVAPGVEPAAAAQVAPEAAGPAATTTWAPPVGELAHMPADALAGAPQVAARRPARRLTAASMLGVAGASLLIVAGIIFVAASWSTYGPLARGAVLFGFALGFVWLARVAHHSAFTTMGAALGVVGAGFAGVSVYALRSDAGHVGAYTTPLALLAGALAGWGLARMGLKAVGLASALAVVLAAHAGAVELAVRAGGQWHPFAVYAGVAALFGLTLIAWRALWGSSRGIVGVGGLVLLGASVIAGQLEAWSFLNDTAALSWWNKGQSAAAAAAVAAALAVTLVLRYRPRAIAGPLTLHVLLTVAAVVAHAGFATEWIGVVMVVCALAMLAAMRWVPGGLRLSAVLGLVPALPPVALGLGVAVISILDALISRRDLELVDRSISSLAVFMILSASTVAAPLAVRSWEPRARSVSTQGWQAAFVALGVLVVTVYGPAIWLDRVWVSAGAIVGAALMWLIGARWAAPRTGLRIFAMAVATGVGTLQTMIVGLSPNDNPWSAAGVALLAVLSLAFASARFMVVEAIAAFLLTGLVAGIASRLTHSGTAAMVTAAAAVVVALGVSLARAMVARRAAKGTTRALIGLLGVAPAAAVVAVTGVVAAAYQLARALGSPVQQGPSWWLLPSLAGCALIGVPLAAGIARARRWSQRATDAVVAVLGTGALAGLAISAMSFAVMVPWSRLQPALAALAWGAAFAATRARWLRPAWRAVGIGAVVVVTLAGLVSAARIGVGGELIWTLSGLGAASLALAVAARWFPRVTLAPSLLLVHTGSLAVAVPFGWDTVMLVGAALAVATVWAWKFTRASWRDMILAGSIPSLVFAGFHALWVVRDAAVVAVERWAGLDHGWNVTRLVGIVLAVAAGLAIKGALARGLWFVTAGLVAAGGFAPAPHGGLALAGFAVLLAVVAARWRGRWGAHSLQAALLVTAAAVWIGPARGALSLVAAAATVAAGLTVALAPRATVARAWGAVLWPLTGGIAAVLGMGHLGVQWEWTVVSAAALVLAGSWWMWAVGETPTPAAVWTWSVVTVVAPVVVITTEHAGLILLLATATWFAASTRGLRWARWVALGLLSPATASLVASLGVTALEAYTGVPAASMLLVGLWWMHRDESVRTYKALAPGLALALVPSYVALVVLPNPLIRFLALVVATGLLAGVGVWRQWFAPLLATATTAIVLASTQIAADESLVPRWIAVAFIGAILLGLGFTAERIRVMR